LSGTLIGIIIPALLVDFSLCEGLYPIANEKTPTCNRAQTGKSDLSWEI
jgi:hypothetical protein